MERSDILIIGGGPAGSSLAHFLKDRNIDSIVIERGGPNRDKVCAGALPVAVKSILPEHLRNFKKVEYSLLELSHKDGLKAVSSKEIVFAYGILRSEFDAYLRSGLDVRYNERFLDYTETKDGIIARTDKGKYFAKFLVGADGIGSRVSLVSGLAPKRRFIVAEEVEIPFKGKFDRTMKIFLGYNSPGYGWIFPKDGFLSVGSGTIRKYFRKNTVQKFHPGEYKTKIYPISLWEKPEKLHKRQVILTGEAANLVDPFCAGGIYPAILSSHILSQTIEKALKSGNSEISGYEDRLEDTIYKEFRYALLLSRLFYPLLAVVKKYAVCTSTLDFASELCSKGYVSYQKIYERAGKSKHLPLKLACLMTKKLFKC